MIVICQVPAPAPLLRHPGPAAQLQVIMIMMMMMMMMPSSRNRARIDEVEAGLFVGSMDAATDILNLEVHGVTHIVTVIVNLLL